MSLSSFWEPIWRHLSSRTASITFLVLISLLLRAAISVGPHSGQGQPPMYGDFEAQRHWMEITIHVPIREWYHNTTDNELQYWGLDYPPLTAYLSWAFGKVAHYVDPSIVALHLSRGIETTISKTFMRVSAIVSDLLFFVPPAILFFSPRIQSYLSSSPSSSMAGLTLLLLQPTLLLIDHGHFQYNSTSLGLTILAVYFLFSKRDILATISFTLALLHKQMTLYYAPAFFSFMLGRALFHHKYPLIRIAQYGITFLLTFALICAPWLTSLEDAAQLLHRMFPFARGLYEDKVANIWCASSLVIKWHKLFSTELMLRLSTLCTLLSLLPSCFDAARRPTRARFLHCMVISSLSFFLFSFQVHEKTILIPLLPACLMASSMYPEVASLFVAVATFSMYPLILKDKIVLQYSALMTLFFITIFARKSSGKKSKIWTWVVRISLAGMAIIHAIAHFFQAPAKYPDLITFLFVIYSCAHFVGFYLFFLYKQFMLPSTEAIKEKEQ